MYCSNCARERNWPIVRPVSVGRCEICALPIRPPDEDRQEGGEHLVIPSSREKPSEFKPEWKGFGPETARERAERLEREAAQERRYEQFLDDLDAAWPDPK